MREWSIILLGDRLWGEYKAGKCAYILIKRYIQRRELFT
jgi:tRNA isopentenyl-2-thiomethyl-A-37 hydroxylase MiaE